MDIQKIENVYIHMMPLGVNGQNTVFAYFSISIRFGTKKFGE